MLDKQIVLSIPRGFEEGGLAWSVAYELVHAGHVVLEVTSPGRRLIPYVCKYRIEVNDRECRLYNLSHDGRRYQLDNKTDVFAFIFRDMTANPPSYFVLPLRDVGKVLNKTNWSTVCINVHANHWAPYRNAWHLLA